MNLKTFFVKYANGLEQVIHAELASVEHFANQHFGTTWGVAQEAGARIIMKDHVPDAQPGDFAKHDTPPPVPTASPTPAPTQAPAPVPPQAPAPAGLSEASLTSMVDQLGGQSVHLQGTVTLTPEPAPAPAPAPAPTGDVTVTLTGAAASGETGGATT